MRTRGLAAGLVLAALGLAGCGDQDSSGVETESDLVRIDCLNGSCDAASAAPDWFTEDGEEYADGQTQDPAMTSTPVPTQTPTYEPPELDRTELDAHLAALSPADRSLFDHCKSARLGEGTWVVAAPMTVDEAVRRLFGHDPETVDEVDEDRLLSGTISGYTVIQVGDGIVAWEDTGFADPPRRLLAALSEGGVVSAVATDNIEGMTRFGYARDGEVVFDNYEYAFVDDLDEIPAEVRDLARLAWDGLEGPMVQTASSSKVAMAMSEKVTGVRATRAVEDGQDWYVVPMPWGVMEDY